MASLRKSLRADLDVDDRRLAGAERALERRAGSARASRPTRRGRRAPRSSGRSGCSDSLQAGVRSGPYICTWPRRICVHAASLPITPTMLIFWRMQASNSIMLRPNAPSPYMMMTSLFGRRELRRHGVARPGAERAERAGVEPVAEAARPQHVGGRADEVAAVADHDGVGRDAACRPRRRRAAG